MVRYMKRYIKKAVKKYFIGSIKKVAKCITGIDFKGQVGQDMLAYMFFRGKKDGFFIDIGANDGVTINNTIVFEKLWTIIGGGGGVAVEPLPDAFNKLKGNRSCDCFNVAISHVSGESMEFNKVVGNDFLGGLDEQMTEEHKKRIIDNNLNIEKIYVKTLTFDDLMSNYPERRHIDFMSIDVEGAEMSILKAIDFSKFTFGLITIENNENDGGKKLIRFMDEHGYKVYINLCCDIMFIPKRKYIN